MNLASLTTFYISLPFACRTCEGNSAVRSNFSSPVYLKMLRKTVVSQPRYTHSSDFLPSHTAHG